jgi:hypothetical protein
MKKTNIILIILLSCFSIDFYAENKDPHESYNSTSSINLLVQESVSFIKKHAWIITLTPIAIYHHKDITQFITHRPYISSFGLYLGLNYLCDAITDYEKQESLIKIIRLLKKTTLYLVMCHGIKNYMRNKNLSIEPFLDEESFFNSVTANLPYSFGEVTLIILKSYQELKLSLQALNIRLTIESEEFVFLCYASSISMQTLFYLTQNNHELYQKISEFEKKPEIHCQSLVAYLTTEITQTFFELEQLLLESNIQSRAI